MKHYKLYINGEFKNSRSNKSFESIDPSTEETWATVAEANKDDVNDAVEAAYNAFNGEWLSTLPNQRGYFLRKIGDQLKENAELFIVSTRTENVSKFIEEKRDLMPLSSKPNYKMLFMNLIELLVIE